MLTLKSATLCISVLVEKTALGGLVVFPVPEVLCLGFWESSKDVITNWLF